MKRTSKAVLIVVLILSACSRNEQSLESIFVEQLESIQVADSIMLCNLPSSFQDYYALCGEPDSPLYSYPDIIEHLLYSQQIDYDLFIKKVTDISTQAYPDVDHIGILKDVMKLLLNNNLRKVLDQLSSKTESDNNQFWSFVFGGIEGRAKLEEKERVLEEIHHLEALHILRYKYIETVNTGYSESAKYMKQH